MYSDCWSDVLRSHYLTDLVLFHDYRKGLYTPGLDQYARTAAMAADKWQSGAPGKAAVSRDGGYVSVVDGGVAPELRLAAAGTIVVFARPGGWPYTAARRIVYKVTGANGYDFAIANVTQLSIWCNGVSSVEASGSSLAACVMVGVTWVAGAVPKFYGNGVFRANGNNAINPLTDGSTLWIGSAGGALNMVPVIQAVTMFSAQLTGAEISQLHADFMNSAHYL